ncbi:MAG: hypothetical protein P1P58_00840 [Treponema sp.]
MIIITGLGYNMAYTVSMATTRKKHCGNCAYYMTDEDERGNVTDFHHDRNNDEGFCVIRDLFYTVKHAERACGDWMYDDLTPQ